MATGFTVADNGDVLCDGKKVEELAKQVPETPFYLYSKAHLEKNVRSWQDALSSLPVPAFVGYAVKANNNVPIFRHLASLGCGAVLVSGWELRLAQLVGIPSEKLIFNGNGKRRAEIEQAIAAGCYVNVDSEFDLGHISAAAAKVGKVCRVLLRVNPSIDALVHPYLATGNNTCKFGIRAENVCNYLDQIKADKNLELVGVHSHMGSTIKEVKVFHDSLAALLNVVDEINSRGFNISVVNIGGGLGIDYSRKEPCIVPQDLADSVRHMLNGRTFTLVVEPGRSIVANTGCLITKVIGTKRNGDKRFIVVDGSMTEVIRPCLYQAYHHILLASPDGRAANDKFDIVGPVCESGDFLGKERELPEPREDEYLVVFDVGAYCRAMAMNYNMRPMAAEYWVVDNVVTLIRRADTFDDLIRTCEGL